MIESVFTAEFINQIGFPTVIAIILMIDKIKTNGKLKTAVENNTEAIGQIKEYIYKLDSYLRSSRK